MTNCPVQAAAQYNRKYTAEFIEYTFTNSKGKKVYVEEYCLWIKWHEHPTGAKALWDYIEHLTEGVEVDLDAPLTDDEEK